MHSLEGEMIVACHQPNFLPAGSFFAKAAKADVLVLLDDVQFERDGRDHFLNRCRMGTGAWLTVPVRHCPLGTPIKDVMPAINPEAIWNILWARLHNQYPKFTERQFEGKFHQLKDIVLSFGRFPIAVMNKQLIIWVLEELGIGTEVRTQSSLDLPEREDPTDRLVDICNHFGASIYLSGPGGLNYMRGEPFRQSGLIVNVINWQPVPYDRGGRAWAPYLSILDSIYACRPDEVLAQINSGTVTEWSGTRD